MSEKKLLCKVNEVSGVKDENGVFDENKIGLNLICNTKDFHQMPNLLYKEVELQRLCSKGSDSERLKKVYGLIAEWGGIDGGHHKQWLLDQILKQTMPDEDYKKWMSNYADGEDGPHTYTWDVGCPP